MIHWRLRQIKFWLWPPSYVWWQIRRASAMARVDRSSTDGDWETIARPLLHSISRTRSHMESCQLVVGWERNVRQMRTCELLLKRLMEDDVLYGERAINEFNGGSGKRWAQHWDYLQKQDRELLGRIIGKHLCEWWD